MNHGVDGAEITENENHFLRSVSSAYFDLWLHAAATGDPIFSSFSAFPR
jgi:hypothetical protein